MSRQIRERWQTKKERIIKNPKYKMTERSFSKALELFRTLEWLKEIHTRYSEMLAFLNEHDDVVIDSIHFRKNGDSEVFQLNRHRSIDRRYIIEALEDALAKLKAEMITLNDAIEKL